MENTPRTYITASIHHFESGCPLHDSERKADQNYPEYLTWTLYDAPPTANVNNKRNSICPTVTEF